MKTKLILTTTFVAALFTACLDNNLSAEKQEAGALNANDLAARKAFALEKCEALLDQELQNSCVEIADLFAECEAGNCSENFESSVVQILVNQFGNEEGEKKFFKRLDQFAKENKAKEEVIAKHEAEKAALPTIAIEEGKHLFYEQCLSEHFSSEDCIAEKPQVIACLENQAAEREEKNVLVSETEVKFCTAESLKKMVEAGKEKQEPKELGEFGLDIEEARHVFYDHCVQEELTSEACYTQKPLLVECLEGQEAERDGVTHSVNDSEYQYCLEKAMLHAKEYEPTSGEDKTPSEKPKDEAKPEGVSPEEARHLFYDLCLAAEKSADLCIAAKPSVEECVALQIEESSAELANEAAFKVCVEKTFTLIAHGDIQVEVIEKK